MKIIKTVIKLLLSILLQICLFPLRLLSNIFKVLESICRIVKKTNSYLIEQILFEVLK